MSGIILKYRVPPPQRENGLVTMRLPMMSDILHFGLDPKGIMCVWVSCGSAYARSFQESAHDQAYDFMFVNTGVEFSHLSGEYLQTVIDEDIVWHIYRL